MTPGLNQVRFETGGVILECGLVPWDTEIFGFPVAQLSRVEIAEGARPQDTLRQFSAWCDENAVRLVSCRLEHTRLRESMELEGLGFRFIEMVHRPRLDAFDGLAAPRHVLQVSEALPDDLAKIGEIAYSAFTTGRYLLDWRLPPELSRRRYSVWVRNSFADPRHALVKAEINGALVGFFILEHRPDKGVYWHLTAIAPEYQGQGMGISLWLTMLRTHKTEGAAFVETMISAHNAPVINLYSRLGFSFQSAQMTFHWLRKNTG